MILKSYVFLERGAHLASGAEWEPSGAATKTYMFWDGYAAEQARYGEVLRWLKITRSACLWSMRTCFSIFRPLGLVRIAPQLSREMGMSL